MLWLGKPTAMWCLMMHIQAERLALLSMVKKLYRMLCSQCCCIPHLLFILAVVACCAEIWIIVLSLTIEDIIVIEALRATHHVPFTYDSSLVTSLLHQLWDESLCCIDTLSQLSLAILVAVESCHQASTTWR